MRLHQSFGGANAKGTHEIRESENVKSEKAGEQPLSGTKDCP